MVSVIIPTYKRSDRLSRAIESVLDQTYSNIEIIVVDDNGNSKQQEKTKSIIEKYKGVKLITYEKNKGACFARNTGVRNAKGEIIMFLDDDDYYLPKKISIQVKELENKNIDACLCSMKRIDQNNNEIYSNENFPRGINLKEYIQNGNCFTGMIAIKKSSFLKINGFTDIPRFQDKYFMYKFHENNLRIKLIKDQLFVLTEHSEERISLGNTYKISQALKILFEFERKHFSLFNKKEKKELRQRFNREMAKIRTNSNPKVRFKGIVHLFRSNFFSSKFRVENLKTLLKLILSEKLYTKIKF